LRSWELRAGGCQHQRHHQRQRQRQHHQHQRHHQRQRQRQHHQHHQHHHQLQHQHHQHPPAPPAPAPAAPAPAAPAPPTLGRLVISASSLLRRRWLRVLSRMRQLLRAGSSREASARIHQRASGRRSARAAAAGAHSARQQQSRAAARQLLSGRRQRAAPATAPALAGLSTATACSQAVRARAFLPSEDTWPVCQQGPLAPSARHPMQAGAPVGAVKGLDILEAAALLAEALQPAVHHHRLRQPVRLASLRGRVQGCGGRGRQPGGRKQATAAALRSPAVGPSLGARASEGARLDSSPCSCGCRAPLRRCRPCSRAPAARGKQCGCRGGAAAGAPGLPERAGGTPCPGRPSRTRAGCELRRPGRTAAMAPQAHRAQLAAAGRRGRPTGRARSLVLVVRHVLCGKHGSSKRAF
jgi:hypothetical protein